LALGEIDGRSYLFLELERIGGIMVYDNSQPKYPEFMWSINNRDSNGDPEAGTAGDLAPEGLTFIPARKSPPEIRSWQWLARSAAQRPCSTSM
jgi:hypothetical protein